MGTVGVVGFNQEIRTPKKVLVNSIFGFFISNELKLRKILILDTIFIKDLGPGYDLPTALPSPALVSDSANFLLESEISLILAHFIKFLSLLHSSKKANIWFG